MSTSSLHSTLTRRRFLQWTIGLGFSALSAAGYVREIEPRWLSITELELPIRGLSPSDDGKRIAQLSDLHLSDDLSQTRLEMAARAVASHAPDWLVITGDFVTNDAAKAAGLVDPLRPLEMPIYGIWGNHDCWTSRSTISRFLREARINIMVNETVQLGSNLFLAGLDDIWSGFPSLKDALRDVPAAAPTVLLAHEPDFFNSVLHEDAPVALQLSGHSHGGQVRLPSATPDPSGHYSFAPVLPLYGRRYPIGLRQLNNRYVYTNRGLGTVRPNIRFNCRPELTIITLRSA